MTKFNPENKKSLTYGETLGPAMHITDPDDAAQYLNDYAEWLVPQLKDEKIAILEMAKNDANINVDAALKLKALDICRHNLGYYAGYGDAALRERVESLFNCKHPIFGSIKENGQPTAEQAFTAGKKLAKKK